MNEKAIWVTTFAKDMWEASGRKLAESFLANRSTGKLILGLEGIRPDEITEFTKDPKIGTVAIDGDPFLANFLQTHRDIIPAHLGGDVPSPECRCAIGPLPVHSKKHKQPCVGAWFNKNFSRWFRKVVALRLALQKEPDATTVVWVDSDCFFKRAVSPVVLRKWFRTRAGVFYFKNRRPILEAGLVGYQLERGGRRILDAFFARYTSGKFRSDVRWDDCYQLQRAISANRQVLAIDLATSVDTENHAAVISTSEVHRYIEHQKGHHSRGLRIMT